VDSLIAVVLGETVNSEVIVVFAEFIIVDVGIELVSFPGVVVCVTFNIEIVGVPSALIN
jgi:hypothetical protein